MIINMLLYKFSWFRVGTECAGEKEVSWRGVLKTWRTPEKNGGSERASLEEVLEDADKTRLG